VRKLSSTQGGIGEEVLLASLVISTLLFPKAGINYSGVPITLNIFCVIIIIIIYIFRFFQQIQVISFVAISLIIPWFLLVSVRSNSLIESRTLKFGSIYWFLIAPLFWITVENLLRNNRTVPIKLILHCNILATLYGLGQYVFGLRFFSVPGLTIAWGDTYARKNLNLFDATNVVGSKIPSTFQGGNIWGQCSAVILVWIVVFRVWDIYVNRLMKIITIAMPCIGVLLSFSRTALIASFMSLILILLKNHELRLRFLVGVVIVSTILTISAPPNLERFSLSSFTNSAGRTNQWKQGVENFSISDWLFGRSNILPESTFHMEGLLGLFGQVGVVGFLILATLAIRLFSGELKWLGFCIFICLFLDSTYITPPLLLVPAVLKLARLSELKTNNLRML
jgi:hypothetical protein